MKDRIKITNICVIVLVLFSVAATVVSVICKRHLAIAWELLFIAGVCLVRFPYHIAQLRNMTYSYRYRKYSDDFDDEPSDFAMITTKVVGYLCMFLTVIFFVADVSFY